MIQWLVAVTVVPRRGFSCIDPSGRGGALKSESTKTTIGFTIATVFFMFSARSLEGLNMLEAKEKQDFWFLRLRAEGIWAFISGVFFGLGSGGVMALGAVNIYLTDLEQKVEGGFGLRGDSVLDGLVSDIVPTAILLGLDMDKEL